MSGRFSGGFGRRRQLPTDKRLDGKPLAKKEDANWPRGVKKLGVGFSRWPIDRDDAPPGYIKAMMASPGDQVLAFDDRLYEVLELRKEMVLAFDVQSKEMVGILRNVIVEVLNPERRRGK